MHLRDGSVLGQDQIEGAFGVEPQVGGCGRGLFLSARSLLRDKRKKRPGTCDG